MQGTKTISNKYERVGFIYNGIDRSTKYGVFEYLKSLSKKTPNKIISIKELGSVPVVVETMLRNSNIYGTEFRVGNKAPEPPLVLAQATHYVPQNLYNYQNTTPNTYHSENFSGQGNAANALTPVNRETGTVAISAVPNSDSGKQMLLNIYALNNNNSIEIYYENRKIFYTLTKDGGPFAQMEIEPAPGQTFVNHEIIVT